MQILTKEGLQRNRNSDACNELQVQQETMPSHSPSYPLKRKQNISVLSLSLLFAEKYLDLPPPLVPTSSPI